MRNNQYSFYTLHWYVCSVRANSDYTSLATLTHYKKKWFFKAHCSITFMNLDFD